MTTGRAGSPPSAGVAEAPAWRRPRRLRLAVFPVVLGAGRRLFDTPGTTTPLPLVTARVVGDGPATLTYRPVKDR
ncbi:hypothetical protein RKD26_006573 [Streptomyces calvus]